MTWCPLPGAGAGARGGSVPWWVHKCMGRALSSAGVMLAIGHVQMCLACNLFLREPKVSMNFTSVPLRAILKLKDIFFPMFPCIRLGKLSKLNTPQWVDALFVAKWVSIK